MDRILETIRAGLPSNIKVEESTSRLGSSKEVGAKVGLAFLINGVIFSLGWLVMTYLGYRALMIGIAATTAIASIAMLFLYPVIAKPEFGGLRTWLLLFMVLVA
ncbi:MAG: hypothetical protein HY706_15755, partial [Candidatus Hydrogenedentes bacterium]|nr:hypothetical protein [Candidatus Hydrogenedentota bacterium]